MTSGEHEDSLLTVAEVAETLRLNQQTVRNWIDAGSLPAIRVGRRVRIKRSDLNQILESGYSIAPPVPVSAPGPSAHDFWGGEPVGAVEAGPGHGAVLTDAQDDPTEDAARTHAEDHATEVATRTHAQDDATEVATRTHAQDDATEGATRTDAQDDETEDAA